jgi:hypothetical protein
MKYSEARPFSQGGYAAGGMRGILQFRADHLV